MIGDAEWRLTGLEIGSFNVTTSLDLVRQFTQATSPFDCNGSHPLPEVPLTFPISWLGRPDVKQAIFLALSENPMMHSHALIQLEQDFEYHARMVPDASYRIDVRLHGPDKNGRCRMEVAAYDDDHSLCMTMSVGFLLVEKGEITP